MNEIKAGIYRHWKGPLYLVLGVAHDANADALAAQLLQGDGAGSWDWEFLGERTVVVYVPLELDGAHLGPRMAVRTVEDFLATVHTEDGTTCLRERCTRMVGRRFADRFTYLGPELTAEMLHSVSS